MVHEILVVKEDRGYGVLMNFVGFVVFLCWRVNGQ